MFSTQSLTELEGWLAEGTKGSSWVDADSVTAIVQRLAAIESEAVSTLQRCTGFSKVDCAALWHDQQEYLNQFYPWPQLGMSTSLKPSRRRSASLMRRPYGNVLVCLPSNAPVPLMAILAVCGLAAGNRVVLTRPTRVAPIVELVGQVFDDVDGLAVWTGSARELVSGELSMFDHVYFMGASSAYSGVAANCARHGVSLHFEGQGNGFAVVGASAEDDVEDVVHNLLRAKSFYNGQMCSAPNGVLVAESLLPKFWDVLTAKCSEYQLTDTLGNLVTGTTWSRIAETGRSTCEPDDWRGLSMPVFVQTDRVEDALEEEFFAPVAWLGSFGRFDAALAMVSRSRYKLQVSYFGHDATEMNALLGRRFARYCLNMNPADQDPVLPWGNFGLSGQSRVQTFFDKFLEDVIVEGTV